jgi:hypothetical protein
MILLTYLFFYGEGLLAPRPTSKLEDYPLSLPGCLFNIFTPGGRPSIRNLSTRHSVLTGTYLTWIIISSVS